MVHLFLSARHSDQNKKMKLSLLDIYTGNYIWKLNSSLGPCRFRCSIYKQELIQYNLDIYTNSNPWYCLFVRSVDTLGCSQNISVMYECFPGLPVLNQ